MIEQWIENGERGSVAVYGTSVERLTAAIEAGCIPGITSQNAELPYQQELTENGRHLYLTYPNTRNLWKSNPDVYEHLSRYERAGEYPDGFDYYWKDITNWNYLKERAKQYALWTGIKDRFLQLTGVYRDEDQIWAIAYLLYPEIYAKYQPKIGGTLNLSQAFAEKPQGELTAGKKLKKAVDESLAGRGVLIFYGPSVFDKIESYSQGREDPVELLLISEKPLTLDTIAGIRCSGKDLKALLDKKT